MIFIILILNLISYGQMLGMGIWKDDNAIFFKLQHINESAGFFGKGLIGDSMYRFSFTPYWFIYKIFGENNTIPYYLFIFILYFLASIIIYIVFSKFISKKGGVIASILFSCGLIGSEGYYWLANAFVSDLSIILFSLMLLSYYIYSQKKKPLYYILSIMLFWATAYFVPIRSYYFIAPVILFEIFFLINRRKLKPIILSIVRTIPFVLIFRHFFLIGADTRTSGLKDLFISLLKGNLYNTYGMLSSLSNSVIADNITVKTFDTFGRFSWILVIILGSTIFYFLARKTKFAIFKTLIVLILFIIWNFASKSIFSIPVLNLSFTSLFTVFLGGIVLFLLTSIYFYIGKKYKNKYIFLFLSFLFSIAAYYAYDPLVSLNTTHRYLTGAFYFIVVLFTLCFIAFGRKTKYLIALWGIFNLIGSVVSEHNILIGRSFPVQNFYDQLKVQLPAIRKGSTLYFDLANEIAKNHFSDAISTASMPNETSFAWRYGIDRYDFKIKREFSVTDTNSFNSFYYDGENLIDTTRKTKYYLETGQNLEGVPFLFEKNIAHLSSPIDIISPIQVKLKILAAVPDIPNTNFPLNTDPNMFTNTVAQNQYLRNLAFTYKKTISNILKESKISASSSWMTDLPERVLDKDINTNWRANRITWNSENTFIGLDLGKKIPISKLVWINGFGNSTPTNYLVEVSNDNINWRTIAEIKLLKRIDDKIPQTISFSPENVRYIRLNIKDTLDKDAPQIAEIWPIPSDLNILDIKETDAFLNNPLGYVPTKEEYLNTLSELDHKGKLTIKWLDKSLNTYIYYDNRPHEYTLNLPAGGYKFSDLVFNNDQINSALKIQSIDVRYLKLQDIKN